MINVPNNSTVLDIKNAIFDREGIPVANQELQSSTTRLILNNHQNLSTLQGNGIFLFTQELPNDPISISFLGSPKYPDERYKYITGDTAPLGILGDLELQLAHNATVNDLVERLKQENQLKDGRFSIGVDNMIFTIPNTPLINYRGKKFQIFPWQPQN